MTIESIYDFYGRGLATAEDVKEYFATWFRRIDAPEDATPAHVYGGAYVPVWGFTRASFSHTICVDQTARKYILIVADNCVPETPAPVLQGEFTGFEDAVNEIAAFFARLWRL